MVTPEKETIKNCFLFVAKTVNILCFPPNNKSTKYSDDFSNKCNE